MKRIDKGVTRGGTIAVEIDGHRTEVYPGETVAVAVLAAHTLRFREDRGGAPRGMFCNMGTCSECTVWVTDETGRAVRRRACMTPACEGMRIFTAEPEDPA